jgi:hypothetical protein
MAGVDHVIALPLVKIPSRPIAPIWSEAEREKR